MTNLEMKIDPEELLSPGGSGSSQRERTGKCEDETS